MVIMGKVEVVDDMIVFQEFMDCFFCFYIYDLYRRIVRWSLVGEDQQVVVRMIMYQSRCCYGSLINFFDQIVGEEVLEFYFVIF